MPHREKEIERIAFNLVEALNGQIPSNMILYGVTGAGKTAVTLHVTSLLKEKGEQMRRDITPVIVNCRQIDTQYRVLSHIGNSLLEDHEIDEIPFTGWPTDRVFKELVRRMDSRKGVYVIVLDEIDHLVRKAGDDLLYNLTNLNSFLDDARACVIGISNVPNLPNSSTLMYAHVSDNKTFCSRRTMLNNSKTFYVSAPMNRLHLMLSQKVLSPCLLLLQLKSTVMPDALLTCFVFQPRKLNNSGIKS